MTPAEVVANTPGISAFKPTKSEMIKIIRERLHEERAKYSKQREAIQAERLRLDNETSKALAPYAQKVIDKLNKLGYKLFQIQANAS